MSAKIEVREERCIPSPVCLAVSAWSLCCRNEQVAGRLFSLISLCMQTAYCIAFEEAKACILVYPFDSFFQYN